MFINVTRPDGHDVRLHLREHLAVIREALLHLEFLQRTGEALLISIRDRHDLCRRDLHPHGVNAMAVVAVARVADDGDLEFACGISAAGIQCQRGGGSGGDEMTAIHKQ